MFSDAGLRADTRRSTAARRPRTVSWLALGTLTVVTALAATFAWLIYLRVIRANLPISWDEAAHSLFGLTIADDMRRGDLVALGYDTYRQVYWPPLHSWLTGVAFLAFGDRIEVSRTVSLLAYALLPIVLVCAARAMYPREERLPGWIAALVAGVLAVAMPAFIPYASLAFLELPALLAVTFTLWAAFFAERARAHPRRRMLIALGILAAFFLKTNYGILLMIVFALDALLDARFTPGALFSQRNLYVVIPVLLVLAVWFAYPPKLAATLRAMVNQPAGANPWTLEGMLYYPRSLLRFAGSPLMLTVLLAGVAGPWPLRRAPEVRLLLLLTGTQFLLGELHQTKDHRHILPMVPAMILLASATAAIVARRASAPDVHARRRRISASLGGAVALLLAVELVMRATSPFPRPFDKVPPAPGPAHEALIAAVREATARGDRVLVVGAFDPPLKAPVVDWDIDVRQGLLTTAHSGAIGVIDDDRSVAAAVRRAPLPGWIARPVLRVLERSDAPGRVRTMYAGLPRRVSADAFASSFGETLRRAPTDVVLLATAVGDTARFPLSYFERIRSNEALTSMSARVINDRVPLRLESFVVRVATPR